MNAETKTAKGREHVLRELTSALRYEPERLLHHPKSGEELRREAVVGLLLAEKEIARLPLDTSHCPDFRFSFSLVFQAFEGALEFFLHASEPGSNDRVALAGRLLDFRATAERALATLQSEPLVAGIIEGRQALRAASEKRWRGRGTRGLTASKGFAVRNLIVFRLLEEMEYLRDVWSDLLPAAGLAETERAAFKVTLHERVREIIELPPLLPKHASKYHKVGVKMLREAAGVRGNFTIHPAFGEGGEFKEFDASVYSKDYLGALSEAWASVAKALEKTDKPKSCQKRSRKG
jgi:hypothetical protein